MLYLLTNLSYTHHSLQKKKLWGIFFFNFTTLIIRKSQRNFTRNVKLASRLLIFFFLLVQREEEMKFVRRLSPARPPSRWDPWGEDRAAPATKRRSSAQSPAGRDPAGRSLTPNPLPSASFAKHFLAKASPGCPGAAQGGQGVAELPVRGRAALCRRVLALRPQPGAWTGTARLWLPTPSEEGLLHSASDKSRGPLAFSSLA